MVAGGNSFRFGSGEPVRDAVRRIIADFDHAAGPFRRRVPFEGTQPGGRTVVATGVVDGVRGLYRIPVDGSSLPELLLPLPKAGNRK